MAGHEHDMVTLHLQIRNRDKIGMPTYIADVQLSNHMGLQTSGAGAVPKAVG